MTFKEKFLATIKSHHLIEPNDNVLIAISGGADSVSLFFILMEIKESYNLNLQCAHINHMIRGMDAINDENFVFNLCNKYNIPLHILQKDVVAYAKEKGYSVENAGREVRYNFFNEVTKGENFKIATAHNSDDMVETYFMNILRGNYPIGIPYKRDNIIRPLLEMTKAEIYDYLKEKKETFVEDKTNFETDYFRNKIRIELFPYINDKFNTNITKVLYNNLNVLNTDNEFLTQMAFDYINTQGKFLKDEIVFERKKFNQLNLSLKRRILKNAYYMICNDTNGYISFEHIDKIIDFSKKEKTGKYIELCDDIIAEFSYDDLIVKKQHMKEQINYYYHISLNEKIFIKEINKFAIIKNEVTIGDNNSFVGFYSDEKNFIIRNRRSGDKIYIENVGHKKLSDVFIDKKIPIDIRNSSPILTDEENNILSVFELKRKAKKCNLYLYMLNSERER